MNIFPFERIAAALERIAKALEKGNARYEGPDQSTVLFYDWEAEAEKAVRRMEWEARGLPSMSEPPGPVRPDGKGWDGSDV